MAFVLDVEQRLTDLGLAVPGELPPPAGAYVPWRLHAGIGFLAAQVPAADVPRGRVGTELSVDEGRTAAHSAALNAVGRIREALDGFERFAGLLHLAGHVASAESFLDQPTVLDGASELFVAAFGDAGRHTRTAFMAPRLPLDVSVELEITFAYEG